MTAGIDNIGAMIRNERLRRDMTQEELGKLVGVGKAQISKIESGKGLTIKTVTKLLGALGLSASVCLKSERRIDKRIVGYIVVSDDTDLLLPEGFRFLLVLVIVHPCSMNGLLWSCGPPSSVEEGFHRYVCLLTPRLPV